MKKLLGLALAAVPLLALPARAQLCCCQPYKVQVGGNVNLSIQPVYPNWSQLGPWYLYWPMEAHFVAPAPTGYPYWPSPQTLPGMSLGGPAAPPGAPGMAPPPAGMPPMAAPGAAPPALKPASYYPNQGGVPSYWYDH
jgi:hypothetical protein